MSHDDQSPREHLVLSRIPASQSADRAEETSRLFAQAASAASTAEVTEIRDVIIRLNMGIAEAIARRYGQRGETLSDLRQVAYLGLTKAVQGYNASQGRAFLPYAAPTISGEIKRHFRDHCWTIRPPRRIQELQHDISVLRQDLVQSRGGEATVHEIADELDESDQSVRDALTTLGCFSPRSLDTPAFENSIKPLGEALPDSHDDIQQIDNKILVAGLLTGLSSEDQEIIVLRFYRDFTQQEIADQIGSSQMAVSRRLGKILAVLRSRLEGSGMPLAS